MSSHGGRRRGAGRKTGSVDKVRRIRLTVMVNQESSDYLKKKKKEKNFKGAVIDEALQLHKAAKE